MRYQMLYDLRAIAAGFNVFIWAVTITYVRGINNRVNAIHDAVMTDLANRMVISQPHEVTPGMP